MNLQKNILGSYFEFPVQKTTFIVLWPCENNNKFTQKHTTASVWNKVHICIRILDLTIIVYSVQFIPFYSVVMKRFWKWKQFQSIQNLYFDLSVINFVYVCRSLSWTSNIQLVQIWQLFCKPWFPATKGNQGKAFYFSR